MNVLKTGDLLVYRPYTLLGRLLMWFQWQGNIWERTEYCHVAIVYNENLAAEMNPPKSRLFSLEKVPWKYVSVYRYAGGVDGDAFRRVVNRRLDEGYDYGRIALFAGVGLLARIGLGAVARYINSGINSRNGDVCSTWGIECLEEAVGKKLFVGLESPRPADIPFSHLLERV